MRQLKFKIIVSVGTAEERMIQCYRIRPDVFHLNCLQFIERIRDGDTRIGTRANGVSSG